MACALSKVSIVGDSECGILASSYCTDIYSENLRFRRMDTSDIGSLVTLFNSPLNYEAYGREKPITEEEVANIVKRDMSRPFYTGYLIESIHTGAVLGRGAIGSGYLPKDDLSVSGSYKAAPLGEDTCEGSAELQIGDFLTFESSELELTEKAKEELYREMLLTLLVAANMFIDFGIKQEEQSVIRVTITIINPERGEFSGLAKDDLIMRKRVIETIFGSPCGILLSKSSDPRNYSEHFRDVYACKSSDLDALLTKNDYKWL